MAVPVVIDISTQPRQTPGTGSEVEIIVKLGGRVVERSGADIALSQRGKGSLAGVPAVIHVPHGETMASCTVTRDKTGPCTIIATNGSQPAPVEYTITVT